MFILLSLCLLVSVWAECPNGCSGHGRCGQYDMCHCNHGFMLDDCSGRTCQFGTSHVDTPTGDLDGSLTITGPDETVVTNSDLYPLGAQEMYPNMVNTDQNVSSNTGHAYAECSNRGLCDREIGECVCYEGYGGSACQFLSCPSDATTTCNGVGTCDDLETVARRDDGNIYELWDKKVTHMCSCDAGYLQPDCVDRTCKIGFDPLYRDIDSSYRYSNWSVIIYHKSSSATITGNYSMYFYDSSGKKWRTDPIKYNASCQVIVEAFERFPNSVVPGGSVRCLKWPDFNSIGTEDEPYLMSTSPTSNPYYGIKYTIAFPRNPGILKPLDIDIYLDEKRPTLVTDEYPTSTLGWFVYPNGFSGESIDYFPNRCRGVDVTILASADKTYQYLAGITAFEFRLLSQCLGNVDFIDNQYSATGRVNGKNYNWDYGTTSNPHVIRLVDKSVQPLTDLCPYNLAQSIPGGTSDLLLTSTGERGTTSLCYHGSTSTDNPFVVNNAEGSSGYSKTASYWGPDVSQRAPGFFAAVIYDPDLQLFKLLSRPGDDFSTATTFTVFTTTGTAQLVSSESAVYSSTTNVRQDPILRPHLPGKGVYSRVLHVTNTSNTYVPYNGHVDCETNGKSGNNGALDCVQKGSIVFFADFSFTKESYSANPKYMNLYTVTRIGQQRRTMANQALSSGERFEMVLDKGINAYYTNEHFAHAYIFYPSTTSLAENYAYATECSNRGNCNRGSGECECFSGFLDDDCSYQSNADATLV